MVTQLSPDHTDVNTATSLSFPPREGLREFLIGAALGDTLGSITEHMSYPEIQRKIPHFNIKQVIQDSTFGDDTHLLLAILLSLARSGNQSLEEFMSDLRFQIEQWLVASSETRLPDPASLIGFKAWLEGGHWSQTGATIPVGSSLGVRVIPIGWYFKDHTGRIKVYSRAISSITHQDSRSLQAAQILGLFTKFSANKIHPSEWPTKLSYEIDIDPFLLQIIEKAERLASLSSGLRDDHSLLSILGRGNGITEILGLTYFILLRYDHSLLASINRASRFHGKSDTLACVVGALQGLRLGIGELDTSVVEILTSRLGFHTLLEEFRHNA